MSRLETWQINERVWVCVLVHNFDGVDVKGGGASGLGGGALATGDSLTLKSRAREFSCCCLANSELGDRVVSFYNNWTHGRSHAHDMQCCRGAAHPVMLWPSRQTSGHCLGGFLLASCYYPCARLSKRACTAPWWSGRIHHRGWEKRFCSWACAWTRLRDKIFFLYILCNAVGGAQMCWTLHDNWTEPWWRDSAWRVIGHWAGAWLVPWRRSIYKDKKKKWRLESWYCTRFDLWK